jgi:hypothetical protein
LTPPPAPAAAKGKRRRRPVVRALAAARQLQQHSQEATGAELAPPTGETVG